MGRALLLSCPKKKNGKKSPDLSTPGQ